MHNDDALGAVYCIQFAFNDLISSLIIQRLEKLQLLLCALPVHCSLS